MTTASEPIPELFHIIAEREWDGAGEELRPPSLAAEGFVHLSTRAQVQGTLERFYAGQEGLVVLCIDVSRLPAEAVIWEDTLGHGERFPHLYAALPRDAVRDVLHVSGGTWPSG